MSIFHDIFTDLVEKRLWPVAIVLLGGLFAVPLALSRPAPPAPVAIAPPRAPADGIAPGEPVVSVATPGRKAALLGRPHDPFKQLYLPKPTKSDLSRAGSGATTPAPGTGTGSSGAGAGGPSGGGAGPTSPAPGAGNTPRAPSGPSTPPSSRPPSRPPAAQPDLVRASIDLRFGRAGAPLRLVRRLPPLSALPSASDPVIIYLGLLHDERTAVFLVSADARPSGDGSCRPIRGACQTVRVLPGQSEFFDVTRADGSVVQYELDLGRVRSSRPDAGAATGAGAAAGATRGSTPRGARPRDTVSLREVQVTARKVMPEQSVDAASLGLGPAGKDSERDPMALGISPDIALVPKLEQFEPEGSAPVPSPGPTPVPEAEGDSPGGLPKLHALSVP